MFCSFRSIRITFRCRMSTELLNVSFAEIGSKKAILYLREEVNTPLYFEDMGRAVA